MTRRIGKVLGLVGCVVMVAACGEDDKPQVVPALPDLPQVFPSSAFAVASVTAVGSSAVAKVLFLNGGRQPLVFSNIELVDDGGGALSMTTRSNVTVASREAVEVVVTFTPVTRGVVLGQLRAQSNAENLPDLVIEVIAPGCASPRPLEPDLAFYEPSIAIDGDEPRGFVRFMNLGIGALLVTGLAVTPASGSEGAFAFPADTVLPTPESPTALGAGGFFALAVDYLPPGAGNHQATISVTSNDADSPVASMTVTGTNQ